MGIDMAAQVSEKIKQWSLSIGALSSLLGAFVMLAFVIEGYVQHDVIRIRGLVLALVLMGLAAIVRSEAHSYVPVPKSRH